MIPPLMREHNFKKHKPNIDYINVFRLKRKYLVTVKWLLYHPMMMIVTFKTMMIAHFNYKVPRLLIPY